MIARIVPEVNPSNKLEVNHMKIAILGFGSVGQKLSQLLTQSGHNVVIGVRAIDEVNAPYPVQTMLNAVSDADMVILAIPYSSCQLVLAELAPSLAGKVVVDCTNPLHADWSPLELVEFSSASEQIAAWLPDSKVIKAFNTIFADMMDKRVLGGEKITAFIAGDDTNAKQQLLHVVEQMGFMPRDVGPLRIARYLEAMAHLNIQIAVGQAGGTSAAFIYAN